MLDPAHQPASSWHAGGTEQETGRFSRTGPESRGAAAGDESEATVWDHRDGGAEPEVLLSGQRGWPAMPTTVCRSARHSTPSGRTSKASTRPDSATVSAVKRRPAGSPGNLPLEQRVEAARAPRIGGVVSESDAPEPALGPGISRIAGTARQRDEM